MSEMAQKITDYATDKELRRTSEEPYRQMFEHILIDDLGYPSEHIDIEVNIQRGANRKAERADIVVFKSDKKVQENAYIVIEIETPSKDYDLQALSYVTATPAPYCAWFSGFERNSKGPFYHFRDMVHTPIEFIETPTLPRYGETQETIGKYRKSDLKPAKALKLLFSRVHFKLYGNGPIKREENVAKEVIKILFCKIFDEQSFEELCRFRATPNELSTSKGRKEIKKRLTEIYQDLLKDPDFADMFSGEKLEYDDYWVSYIVSELQGIAFLHEDTNTDALGDAYEVFLSSTLKGESGQFFTPREVVRFALDVINPLFSRKELVFDPACGSGGFLSIAIENIRKQVYDVYSTRGFTKDKLNSIVKDFAGKYIHGCDIEPLLFRIAKSYMAVVGDGKSNIYNFDSLEPYEKYPLEFKRKIPLGSVDVITTNPPFGTKIDDVRSHVLEMFDLGHRIVDGKPTKELLTGQDPDKLFLERDIQFLKEASNNKAGGRMVIVLPRQNLSGAETASIEMRRWLLSKVQVTAIIDLPREAFQPHTGTKTSLVFLQKVKNPDKNYPIFMAVSESVGHDRRGYPVFRKDDQGRMQKDESGNPIIWNDLPFIYNQWIAYTSGKEIGLKTPSCFIIESNQIWNDVTLRMDAWYYDPNKNNLAKKMESIVGAGIERIDNLSNLVIENGIFYPGRHKRNYVKKNGTALPFYSGTQILQVRPFDLKYQPISYKPVKKHIVEKDWILITRSGSTGRVVIVNKYMAGKTVSEHVIRVICDKSQVDPYYVYAFLASEKVGKILMEKGIYASVVDHLTPDFIGSLPIPRLNEEKEIEIANTMRKAEEFRAKANEMFALNVDGVQDFILNEIGMNEENVE